MTELWKPVVGHEALYEVSDLGRLRRIATYGSKPKALNRIIAPARKATGYLDYYVYADGKPKRHSAHRMVWESFIGPIPPNLVINHKNGIKDDNRLCNLEVMTRSQNTAHGFRVLGRAAPNYPSPGIKNGSAKLDDDKVREIRKLYGTGGIYQHEIAKIFGVSQRMVSLITRREKWTHVE